MSTTIKSLYGKYLTIYPSIVGGQHEVTIEASSTASGNYRLADLLAALRAESILPAEPEPLAEWERELLLTGKQIVPADAVVILRETLPAVVVEEREESGRERVCAESDHNVAIRYTSADPDVLRGEAYCLLAIAEYIDANPPKPPVDPTQVVALAVSLFNARWPGKDWTTRANAQRDDYQEQARRLYLAGVRIEATR